MKATLEFELPQDTNELFDAENGAKYLFAISDVMNELRNLLKHDGYKELKLHRKTLEYVRELIIKEFQERDLGHRL